VYGHGPDLNEKERVLEITNCGTLKQWAGDDVIEDVMACYTHFEFFAWWHWADRQTLHLYFRSQTQLECAQSWLRKMYPSLWIAEKVRNRRSSCPTFRV